MHAKSTNKKKQKMPSMEFVTYVNDNLILMKMASTMFFVMMVYLGREKRRGRAMAKPQRS